MHNHELYQRLLIEAASIRSEMSCSEIVAVEDPHLRAFAMLVSRTNFRGHTIWELAKTVNGPEAGDFGRKVQDEVRAACKTPTKACEKAFEKRRRAYLNAMDGLLFVEALAQGAFDLRMAAAEVEAV